MQSGRYKLILIASVLALLALETALWIHGWLRVRETRTELKQSVMSSMPTPEVSASPDPAPASLQTALENSLREDDPRQRSMHFGQLLTRWFEQEPEGALAYLKSLPPDSAAYTEGLFIVLPRLAVADPARAIDLAREMATTHEQQSVYSALFDGIARRGRATALGLIENVPEGEGRDNALRAVAVSWADENVLEALEWAKQLGKPAEKSAAIEATLIVRSKRDPRRTIDLARELLSGPALTHTLTEALRYLTAQDARAAGEVVLTLPDDDVKSRAALEVARSLASEQPQLGVKFVESLPPGQLQSLALSNVLNVWSVTDPAAAARWARTLPADSGARTPAIISIMARWMRSDPTAARQFASTLSPADQDLVHDAVAAPH
jgi:hypothetical protein